MAAAMSWPVRWIALMAGGLVSAVSSSPLQAREPAPCALAGLESAIGDAGCSALLVGPTTILTAGHCADPRRYQLKSVTFGRGEARQVVGIASCEPHPSFDGVSPDFDLALCRLAAPVTGVRPVELATAAEPAKIVGRSACVMGYRDEGAERTLRASSARVRQVPSAGSARLVVESCAGDSGSPVFLSAAGRLVPFGVLSGGEAGGARCSNVTTAARLAPALEWLAQRTARP
jgi:hypothetical protein